MKIIILGAKGMLGTDLMEVFSDYQPVGLTRDELNITSFDTIKSTLSKYQADILINAAAFTKVDECEKEQELAYEVNGQAVGFLAKYCRQLGITLVHFSTDYVFDGKKKKGYKENDTPRPLSIYGKSKLLGEKIIITHLDNYYLIRTAWLYGKHGKNFVDTMIELSKKEKELKIVNDQFGNPTYTFDLAQITRRIIERKSPFGIYHVTNSGSCSWYDYAKKIFEILGKSVKIKPVKTEEFPRPAKRPKYSILKNSKLKPLRHWHKALKEYLSNR